MEKSKERYRKDCLGPTPRVRSDDELWDELRGKLIDTVNRPDDFYTLAKLIARLEEILVTVKKEDALRQAFEAIPYEPEDD